MLNWLRTNILTPFLNMIPWVLHSIRLLWQGQWWVKLILIIIGLFLLILASSYGVARWYAASNAHKPLALGVTFVPDYARSLELDAEQTMDALINDVGVNRFRLVSYWNKIEQSQGTYNFEELDWQFSKAEAANAKISLALGLRQPRWPECHMPEWAKALPVDQWQPKLEQYTAAVINRYKNSPSLDSYQLENEYFNDFGDCPSHERSRLISEAAVVKQYDPDHTLIISRSNNFPLLVLGKPQPDEIGVSVYRRVWDSKFTKRYMDYPMPSWYYAAIAGTQKLVNGKDSMLHELQMEPWPANGKSILTTSIEEQDYSMNAEMFDDRIDFAKNTGLRTVDLWGAEWWYWRKMKMNDPSLWNEAKEAFSSE